MIHIIITIQARPLTVVLHHFETKQTSPDELQIGRVIRTFLQPWLKRVAMGHQARFRIIE